MKPSENDLRRHTYTTGAYITPFYDEKNDRYIWMVVEFDDDTFCDGEIVSPIEETFGDVMDLLESED